MSADRVKKNTPFPWNLERTYIPIVKDMWGYRDNSIISIPGTLLLRGTASQMIIKLLKQIVWDLRFKSGINIHT